jgi:LPXTG-site transpeptidase (sortase) family protein
LGSGIGYLEGSAYLTHPGNTVLAGHVYLSDGTPGPFIDLHHLKWGDRIILHVNGYAHVYAVRHVYETTPDDIDVLRSWDDYDWLTLITCRDFDERTNSYRSRLIVEAVRIE